MGNKYVINKNKYVIILGNGICYQLVKLSLNIRKYKLKVNVNIHSTI